MFIFWGTKRVQKKLGYVADFCPICRGPQAFRLTRISMAGHVYGVSLSSGKLVGFERLCLNCKTVLDAEHENYTSIAKAFPLERVTESGQISELIRLSNPQLEQRYAHRLELERELRRGNLPADGELRRRLIKEPFVILAQNVEREFAETRIDLPLLLTVIGAILAPVGLFWLLDTTLTGEARELLPVFLALVCLCGLIVVMVQGYLVKNRHLRKHFYPKLARSLAPLRPQSPELAAALSEIRQLGFTLGKRTKPAFLEPLLHSA